MLSAGGTGVATYARSVRAAQMEVAEGPLLVSGRDVDGDDTGIRLPRLARALRPGVRRAQRAAERIVSPDIFRVAQVYFNLHRDLLTVRVPGPPGLVHWIYPVPIRLEGWANIYTVHDAIPLAFPALSPINAGRHRLLLGAVARHAARIITVSEAARDEILEHARFDPSLVVNLSQPVDVSARDPEAAVDGLPPRGYLLACGSVEPRKNILRVLAAYQIASSRLPLVVAGPPGWMSENIERVIAETPGVVRIPQASRDEVLNLIADARALIMPSLAEGFGLPVAEAMALGTPVLTSSRGALAETAGDAALLVDPTSETAIATAIDHLTYDDMSCEALRRAGLMRAATRFGFHDFASRLAMLYEEVLRSAFRVDCT